MIRSWLRRFRRGVITKLGLVTPQDLFGALGDNRAELLQSFASEFASFRSFLIALLHEERAAYSRLFLADSRSTIEKQFKELDLDRWKIRELEGLLRYLRRCDYLQAIRDGALVVPRLETEHPVAVASNDTKFPRGAKNDNSIAPRFNRKLSHFLAGTPHLRVLDVGCAGGGFVRSLIDDGHFAVGLEGSDYPLLNQTGEWSTIPLSLLTCDITKPMQLYNNATNEPLLFDVITAWEVMEHIPEEGLGCMFENLERHLAPRGYLFLSIATHMDWDPQTGTIWHVTLKPRQWWEDWFTANGFVVEDQHPFGNDDWVRGSGQCRGDWHHEDRGEGFQLVDVGMGFHVVLKRKSSENSRVDGSNECLARAG